VFHFAVYYMKHCYSVMVLKFYCDLSAARAREQCSQATLVPTQRNIESILHFKDKLTFEFICIEIEVYILEIRIDLR